MVSEREGVLSRIDPATGAAHPVLNAAPALDYVVDAVTAVDGGAWVRNLAAQTVERFDVLTGQITQHASVGGVATWGVTDPGTITSTDAAVWVTVSDALVRIDRRTLRDSHLQLVDPTGVTAAADGTLWVATAQGMVLHVAPGSG